MPKLGQKSRNLVVLVENVPIGAEIPKLGCLIETTPTGKFPPYYWVKFEIRFETSPLSTLTNITLIVLNYQGNDLRVRVNVGQEWGKLFSGKKRWHTGYKPMRRYFQVKKSKISKNKIILRPSDLGRMIKSPIIIGAGIEIAPNDVKLKPLTIVEARIRPNNL